MTVYENDIYGLVGPNGSGKSTILKLIAHWIRPDRGSIELFDYSNNESYKALEKMGFLIEEPVFYDYLTGKDNIKYLGKIKNIKPDLAMEIVREFRIDDQMKKKVKTYSTGYRKSLGLAVAMMNRPNILVLDEPVNGLDPERIVDLRNLLLKINREWNTTIVLSSHLLNELSLIATRYGFIKNGVLLEEISQEELLDKSRQFIEIHLEPDDLKKTIVLLEEYFNMNEYRILPKGELRIYESLNVLDIQKLLIKHEIYTLSIKNKNSSLEDYYLNLLGGKAHD